MKKAVALALIIFCFFSVSAFAVETPITLVDEQGNEVAPSDVEQYVTTDTDTTADTDTTTDADTASLDDILIVLDCCVIGLGAIFGAQVGNSVLRWFYGR